MAGSKGSEIGDYQALAAALGDPSATRDSCRPLAVTLQPGQAPALLATCRESGVALCDTIDAQLREWVLCSAEDVSGLDAHTIAAQIERTLAPHDGDSGAFGHWFYYPWRQAIVHLLPKDAFHTVCSNRNRDKITRDEQRVAKSLIAARELAEINPYLDVKVYADGVSDDSIEHFLSADARLDLVVEECDSLDIKLLLRERARALGIPVVMDTNDRGLLDIERFDKEPSRPLLHGLLGDLDHQRARALSRPERRELFDAFFGGRQHMSARFRDSLARLGTELLGASQLSSDVHLGAALVASAVRRILLGQIHRSGRHVIDLAALIAD